MLALSAGLIYMMLLALEAAVIVAGVFVGFLAFIFGRAAYPIFAGLLAYLVIISW